MRGREKMNKQMRRGRTIVAEREQAESESERMQARRKAHRKKTTAAMTVLLMGAVLALSAYLGMEQLSRNHEAGEKEEASDVQIMAQIVDEDGRGQISTRMKRYIAQLEGDFRDLGYTISKVTLPTGAGREIYVDIVGREGMFIKINTDRETAVSAEDATRMLKYLDERDLHPGYLDVRVAGKAYYK